MNYLKRKEEEKALGVQENSKKFVSAVRGIFTEHPYSVGESYFEHLFFTIFIVIRSIVVAGVFLIHGFFPFIAIPKFLNLEGFIEWLRKANDNRENKKVM